jgi:hypothetical protein
LANRGPDWSEVHVTAFAPWGQMAFLDIFGWSIFAGALVMLAYMVVKARM